MTFWTSTITLEIWFFDKLFEFTAMTIAILIGQMWIHKKYIISLNRTFTILCKILQKKCSSVIKVHCDREESKDICTMHAQSLSLDYQQSFFRPCIVRNVSLTRQLRLGEFQPQFLWAKRNVNCPRWLVFICHFCTVFWLTFTNFSTITFFRNTYIKLSESSSSLSDPEDANISSYYSHEIIFVVADDAMMAALEILFVPHNLLA